MNLQQLLADANISGLTVEGCPNDCTITDIQLDSRLISADNLFAALPGTQVDGASFAASAVNAGAVAILASSTARLGDTQNAIVLRHAEPSYALSQLCRAYFKPLPSSLVAVTGTNGKTSVATFLRQIWQASGKNAASIGTLGVHPKDLVSVPELTSPDAVTLHRALSGLKKAGIDHVAMEASSHGLDQHRLHGLTFSAAGFTNLTQDHLDYHGTMERYLAAKARLFHELCDGPSVVNANQAPLHLMDALPSRPIIRVGETGSAPDLDISFRASPTPKGLSLELSLPAGGFMGTLAMVGRYQAENVALAAGLALASGLSSDAIVEAIAGLRPAPGRMDWAASHPVGGPILVDYAHTPDALAAAIAAARPHVSGRLIVVFGAGGDRDPSKRGGMGAVVARDADMAIVTDDNPRTEDPAGIRRAILTACPSATEIGDRREAIAHAIAMMQPGDGVLIAGKGHEMGQKIGHDTLPFDDIKTAQELAATLL